MSEQSGCRFQLGEENDPFNTNERIVTITGTTSPSVVTVRLTVNGMGLVNAVIILIISFFYVGRYPYNVPVA